jgi:rhodanese-related sulfurtransferase
MYSKKTYNRLFILLLALGLSATAAFAGTEGGKKADWKYHDIVALDFVKQYVKVPHPEGVMIIDSRPKRAKYDKGHIPSAVSIPYSKFDKMTDKLPQDKNTLLIFYCGGLKCPLSHKSAWKAEKLGYKNVKVFAKGFPAWMKVPGHYAEVSTAYVKKMVDGQKNVLVVDSRPKRKKYDKGHIPTAVSIPYSKFDKMTDQLPQDKNTQLIFYCGGFKCPLSHKSAAKAIKLGYKKVSVFAAGYPAWKKAYGGAVAGAGIKAGKEEGSIDIAAFEKIIHEKPGTISLIDVRDPSEFSTGSFNTAVNIPSEELEKEIKTLATDKPIVFICSTGARSGEAYYMVKDLRPEIKDVFYLEAELTINKDGSYKIVQPQQ